MGVHGLHTILVDRVISYPPMNAPANSPLSMKTVHKSVLLWHSAEQMFALVTDVPRYSEFLPWCHQARVLEVTPEGMVAEIGMSLSGFKKSFTTRNTHVPGRQVKVELVDGPFKQLDGVWDFHPIGDGAACKIELKLNYAFESLFGSLVGPVFDRIASTLVDAFVKRADQVYPS
jgi:ribosome-associated toxin RatA of RatAB toxin-antitoxin module